MMITRKTKVPWKWAFYAQLPLILSIYGNMVINAPFLLLIKKFIDNPAAIMGLISIEVYLTLLGGPFVAWLSDRIWTRFGRRKIFVGPSDLIRGFILMAMPFAPNLWILIVLRWLYGVFGDLASPCVALIWEVVPSKQRGRSSGMKSAFMNLGNLIFFWLLLGRFDDVYFMGPFAGLSSVSGGTILFWIGALVLIGIALFEFLGIKEIYPPDRKKLRDEKPANQSTFLFFAKTMLKDILAKDLVPIYLFMFSGIMFAFSLGIFQPLLFTEQWGYSLQEMGNNIAVGVVFGVIISFVAGWLADAAGKMTVYLGCLIAGLFVDTGYTIYVYFQPDFRPDLWEIIMWGNIGLIFNATKGVVAYALMWEYVRRSRMGAMTAGQGIFNTLFRNGVALFMGFWLLWWSIWFFPQGGYNVEATFAEEKSAQEVRAYLEAEGVDLEGFTLEPRHQFGVDGETSMRWWIHHNVEQADDLLKERKDLENKIEGLTQKKASVFTRWFSSEEAIAQIQTDIDATRARVEEIEAVLEAAADALREKIEPALDTERFPPGEQILSASLTGTDLLLEVRTIEVLPEKQIATLEQKVRGPEHALVRVNSESRRLEPKLAVTPLPEVPGVRLTATLDPGFIEVFGATTQAGLVPEDAYSVTSATLASLRALVGREGDAFTLEATDTTQEGSGTTRFRLTVVPGADSADFELDDIAPAFQQDPIFASAATAETTDGFTLDLELASDKTSGEDPPEVVQQRLEGLLGTGERSTVALFAVLFEKLESSLASRPIYITVPSHDLDAGYSEREYEYFFSSQTIQISTNVIGILIVALIAYLEKRGVVVRHGAKEDLNR